MPVAVFAAFQKTAAVSLDAEAFAGGEDLDRTRGIGSEALVLLSMRCFQPAGTDCAERSGGKESEQGDGQEAFHGFGG